MLDLSLKKLYNKRLMPPNMVLNYILERENVEYLEYEWGFMFVQKLPSHLYIQDIYVKPELRGKKYASKMLEEAEKIANLGGFKAVLGSCDPAAVGSTHSLKTMLSVGFELHSVNGNLIYLEKKLNS